MVWHHHLMMSDDVESMCYLGPEGTEVTEDTSAKEIKKWAAWEERQEGGTDICGKHAGGVEETHSGKQTEVQVTSRSLLSKVCAFYKEHNKVSLLGGFLSPPQAMGLGKHQGNSCLRLSFILREYKVSSKDESQAQGGAELCLRGSQQDPQMIEIQNGYKFYPLYRYR